MRGQEQGPLAPRPSPSPRTSPLGSRSPPPSRPERRLAPPGQPQLRLGRAANKLSGPSDPAPSTRPPLAPRPAALAAGSGRGRARTRGSSCRRRHTAVGSRAPRETPFAPRTSPLEPRTLAPRSAAQAEEQSLRSAAVRRNGTIVERTHIIYSCSFCPRMHADSPQERRTTPGPPGGDGPPRLASQRREVLKM